MKTLCCRSPVGCATAPCSCGASQRRPPNPTATLHLWHASSATILHQLSKSSTIVQGGRGCPLILRSSTRRRCRPALAAAAPAPHITSADQAQYKQQPRGLAAILHPFSDPAANSKLLALCTAQMLSSVSSLLTETYLPVYLSDVLHLSHTKIGNLQGTAQLLAKVSGSLSGTLADVLSPARMLLVGAALSATNKPMYAAAGWVAATAGATACAYWIAFAKIFDRVAKGIREAPSKALMGELAAAGGDPPSAAFALRQSLGTLGALGGALAASAALRLSGYNYNLTFALACVPAAAAVGLLLTAFGGGGRRAQDGQRTADGVEALGAQTVLAPGAAVSQQDTAGLACKARLLAGALHPAYWQALATVGLLYFARFDVGFATLRAKTVMDRALLPCLIPCMMVTQAVLAAPMGMRARTSVAARNRVLLQGMSAMIAADACFALVPSAAGMVCGALLLGVHMAMTHGVSLGMIASYIPSSALPGLGPVAGTCWSLTDLMLGVVLAASNSLAGRLSDATAARGMGGTGCFAGGAAASALAMAALALFSAFGELGQEDLVKAKGAATSKESPAAVEGGSQGAAAHSAAPA